jgi:hypothetical protein
VYDGTAVPAMTVPDFTASHGGDGLGAEFGFYFGCDGNPFAVDALRVGSSANGWHAYDFDGYRSRVSLRSTRSRNTCQTSPGRWPNRMSFKGRHSPAGPWQGWQYVGTKKGHWRKVAQGTSSRYFRYSAPVKENSWFDAAHPYTAVTEYSDSRDLYVPAFASIRMRASRLAVRRGTPMVFTGTIRPARRLSYVVLRSVPVRGRWGAFQSLGAHKTNARGRFRFTVPTPRTGWAQVALITRTERDLTSTITPRPIRYEVLKPRKRKQPTSDPTSTQPQEQDAEQDAGGQVPGGTTDHDGFALRTKGFGRCGWIPTGRPPSRIQGRGTTSQPGLAMPVQRSPLSTSPGPVAPPDPHTAKPQSTWDGPGGVDSGPMPVSPARPQ